MKRVVIAEWLDTDNGTPDEVAASLLDLHFFNKWFGGISTTAELVKAVAKETGKKSFSWLEVAAGSGVSINAVRQELGDVGVDLNLTLLDRASSHVGNGNHGGRIVVGDALALPFTAASFDLVGSNLFAHHLIPEQIIRFAQEGLRICRDAFVINDLIRDPLHLGLAYLGAPIYRSRITRHDAPASVRQAYSVDEMRDLLQQAGASRVEISRHYLYRMGVIAWK